MWKRPFRTLVAIWVVTTFVVSQMGPFGTFETMSALDRVLYWGTIIALAIGISGTVRQAVLANAKRPMHPFALDLIVVPIFTAIYSPILFHITRGMQSHTPTFNFFETVLAVLAVSAVLIGMREAFGLHAPGVSLNPDHRDLAPVYNGHERSSASEHAEHPAEIVSEKSVPKTHATAQAEQWIVVTDDQNPSERSPLIERLPQEYQGELLCISGRDHYVDVVTETGSASILLRFSDALREVSETQGMQVHRSHWVADAAVAGLRRDAHRLFVRLHSGLELPVSRTYAKEARDRWGHSDNS